MADPVALAPNANDGTPDGAVAALAGIDLDNPSGGAGGAELIDFETARDRAAGIDPPVSKQARDPQTGQFQEKKDKPAADPAKTEPVDKVAPDAGDAASPVDEEFFELPPETDGGAPRRIPAAEVFAAYEREAQYKGEIDQLRRQMLPPEELDRQLTDVVAKQHELTRLLSQYQQMMQPAEPDRRLLLTGRPEDTARFVQEQQIADLQRQQLAAITQQLEATDTERKTRERAIAEARSARELAKVRDFWPEVMRNDEAGKAVQARVRQVANALGFTERDVSMFNGDSRLYALLKKAVAHDEMVSAQRTAVKVVRSKPKLVRSGARDSSTQQQSQYAAAMRRVAQTGAAEDAAAAIGAALNL